MEADMIPIVTICELALQITITCWSRLLPRCRLDRRMVQCSFDCVSNGRRMRGQAVSYGCLNVRQIRARPIFGPRRIAQAEQRTGTIYELAQEAAVIVKLLINICTNSAVSDTSNQFFMMNQNLFAKANVYVCVCLVSASNLIQINGGVCLQNAYGESLSE